ncbi:MAG: FAD:protein FMN transferase [Armatimonadota bacterium]
MRVVIAGVLGLVGAFSVPQGQTTQKAEQLTRFTLVEYHMGIDARIVLYASSQGAANRAAEAAFKRIAELEQAMSDYRPSSELMQFCAKPRGTKIKLSPDLFKVLDRSQHISKQTDGRFDCTVGPLVQLWRKARKSKVLPSIEEIKAAQGLVSYRFLHLDRRSQTAWLDRDGMKLDLGGIAKGYASDQALRALQTNGIKIALIEMGGDLVLGEAPPEKEGWEVEIPNAAKTLHLKNCAVSSSGDTEQFVEIGGVRYSHVVDTRTGYGLSDRVQATIIAPNGFTTDPLSTALTLLDEKGRAKLQRLYPGTQVFIKVAK